MEEAVGCGTGTGFCAPSAEFSSMSIELYSLNVVIWTSRSIISRVFSFAADNGRATAADRFTVLTRPQSQSSTTATV
jgi:hypothetical protein